MCVCMHTLLGEEGGIFYVRLVCLVQRVISALDLIYYQEN